MEVTFWPPFEILSEYLPQEFEALKLLSSGCDFLQFDALYQIIRCHLPVSIRRRDNPNLFTI